MWLFTETGFYSVVIDAQNQGRMLIRCRCAIDAANLWKNHHDALPSMTDPFHEKIVITGGDFRSRGGIGSNSRDVSRKPFSTTISSRRFTAIRHKVQKAGPISDLILDGRLATF